jgi:two-component system, NtrC family, response regulator AtoC
MKTKNIETMQRNELVLIVDDEKLLRWSLKEQLSNEGYQILEAGTGAEARAILDNHFVDIVLLDIKLPDCSGLEILRSIHEKELDVTVLLMTAYSSIENAVEAMRMGAFNYLTKPFDTGQLSVLIDRALEATALKRKLARIRASQENDSGLDNLIGGSQKMLEIFKTAIKVARSPATTVLIMGESGVGKDMLAKAIHLKSDRADHNFMNITCTTITENLLESELFGHERGAFTDAKSSRKGLFELAHKGTVFLDEIGDMPSSLQSKLLRFLQEKTFKRVGGSVDITVDVRIIAATNKNLGDLVSQGHFREDLYYRLNVIDIQVPPLREREGDVKLLAQYFVAQFNKQFRKSVKGITKQAEALLKSYQWPGNVRELKNIIERAMILGGGEWIDSNDFPRLIPKDNDADLSSNPFLLPDNGLDLEDLEKSLIIQALKRSKGVKTKAGALLGMNRDQVRYRMEKYDIKLP